MTRIVRILVMCTIVGAWPSVASAQLDILWDWGERFIGPGPWVGINALHRFECRKLGSAERARTVFVDAECYGEDLDPAFRTYLEGRAGFHATGGVFWNHHPVLFGDLPPEDERFKIVKLELFVMARIHPAVDIGAGAGANYFFGEGFKFVRPIATPLSLVIAPLAALHPDKPKMRFLKFRYEMNYWPWGLDASADFNRLSSYHMDTEWTSRAGFQFDVFAFSRQ